MNKGEDEKEKTDQAQQCRRCKREMRIKMAK
jgi:hypothetical protein